MQKRYLLAAIFSVSFVQNVQSTGVSYGSQTSIGGVNVGLYKKTSIDDKVAVGILGLLLASKVAYDISWHSTYATCVTQYFQSLKQCIRDNDIVRVEDEKLLNFSTHALRQQILFLEKSLSNSYDSWVCPWNWTLPQKVAHCNIAVVSILTLYAELLRLGDQVNEQDVLKYCRNTYVYTTMYPYVACHGKIQNHLEFIKSFVESHKNTRIRQMLQGMVGHLEKFQYMLQEQKEYIEERQIMRTHELLQESINAQRGR